VWVVSRFFLGIIGFFVRTLLILVLAIGVFLAGMSVGEGASEPSLSLGTAEPQIAYIKNQVDSLQSSVQSSLPTKIQEGCALAKTEGYDLCATVRSLQNNG